MSAAARPLPSRDSTRRHNRDVWTAVSIMERMTTGKFRHIPVVERDQLVGIVSIGDIVKHRLLEVEQESRHCANISRAHRLHGRHLPGNKRGIEKAPATMPGRGTGSIPLTSLIRPMPGRPLRDATT